MKSGQLTILGRPNVGKSTLLNALVREKVAIVSDKPQTTRNLILGVGHYPEGQLILLDTPGLHAPRHRLNSQMVQSALGSLMESDVVYVMVDSQVKPGPGDRFVVEQVTQANQERPFQAVFLLINKVDTVNKSRLLPLIDQYRTWFSWTEIVPIAAQTGLHVPRLVEMTFNCLSECPTLMYDDDFLTNQSMRQMAGEMIREKVLGLTYAELPYNASATCHAGHPGKRTGSGPQARSHKPFQGPDRSANLRFTAEPGRPCCSNGQAPVGQTCEIAISIGGRC